MLSSDLSNLLDESNRIIKSGVDWLHIDIMDGHFVENLTFGIPIIKSLRKHCNHYLDVHLMVTDPLKWIERLAEIGVNSVTFHIESCITQNDANIIIKFCKLHKLKVGVAIKPETSINEIMFLINDIDFVLVMTVEPGYSGQKFIHKCLEKISDLRKISPIDIQVDGGINLETLPLCLNSGANIIVSGSTIFNSKEPELLIKNMRDLTHV